jgi:hypothetical protein
VKIPFQAPAVSRQGSDHWISPLSLDGIAPQGTPEKILTKYLLGCPDPFWELGKKGKVQQVGLDGTTGHHWCRCPSGEYVCCGTKKPWTLAKCQKACCP